MRTLRLKASQPLCPDWAEPFPAPDFGQHHLHLLSSAVPDRSRVYTCKGSRCVCRVNHYSSSQVVSLLWRQEPFHFDTFHHSLNFFKRHVTPLSSLPGFIHSPGEYCVSSTLCRALYWGCPAAAGCGRGHQHTRGGTEVTIP